MNLHLSALAADKTIEGLRRDAARQRLVLEAERLTTRSSLLARVTRQKSAAIAAAHNLTATLIATRDRLLPA